MRHYDMLTIRNEREEDKDHYSDHDDDVDYDHYDDYDDDEEEQLTDEEIDRRLYEHEKWSDF